MQFRTPIPATEKPAKDAMAAAAADGRTMTLAEFHASYWSTLYQNTYEPMIAYNRTMMTIVAVRQSPLELGAIEFLTACGHWGISYGTATVYLLPCQRWIEMGRGGKYVYQRHPLFIGWGDDGKLTAVLHDWDITTDGYVCTATITARKLEGDQFEAVVKITASEGSRYTAYGETGEVIDLLRRLTEWTARLSGEHRW